MSHEIKLTLIITIFAFDEQLSGTVHFGIRKWKLLVSECRISVQNDTYLLPGRAWDSTSSNWTKLVLNWVELIVTKSRVPSAIMATDYEPMAFYYCCFNGGVFVCFSDRISVIHADLNTNSIQLQSSDERATLKHLHLGTVFFFFIFNMILKFINIHGRNGCNRTFT